MYIVSLYLLLSLSLPVFLFSFSLSLSLSLSFSYLCHEICTWSCESAAPATKSTPDLSQSAAPAPKSVTALQKCCDHNGAHGRATTARPGHHEPTVLSWLWPHHGSRGFCRGPVSPVSRVVASVAAPRRPCRGAPHGFCRGLVTASIRGRHGTHKRKPRGPRRRPRAYTSANAIDTIRS